MQASRCRVCHAALIAVDNRLLLQVEAIDVASGRAVSEVFGVDFRVKMSKRFV